MKGVKENQASLIAGLEFLRAATSKPRLEVQQVQMLLTLYHLPEAGVHMQQLAEQMKGSQSFVSRNAKGFGSAATGKRFVALRIDDDDPRYRVIYLTPEGRAVMKLFCAIVGGSEKAPKFQPAVDARTKR